MLFFSCYVAWVVYVGLSMVGPSTVLPDTLVEGQRLIALALSALLATSIDRVLNGRIYPS